MSYTSFAVPNWQSREIELSTASLLRRRRRNKGNGLQEPYVAIDRYGPTSRGTWSRLKKVVDCEKMQGLGNDSFR